MNPFLGPLDPSGGVPPLQQTRVAAFLISAHGALARRLAIGTPPTLKLGWQTELPSQPHRETEIATLMMRATSWVADFELAPLCLSWEAAWLAHPVEGVTH